MDAVKVSSDNFARLLFMGAVQRREYTRERLPQHHKPQKKSKSGMPLWSVKVAATNSRGTCSVLSITVPSGEDPAKTFAPGDPIAFHDLTVGVTPKRKDTGFSTWWSATAMVSASAGAADERLERRLTSSDMGTWSSTWWSMLWLTLLARYSSS